jgi:hypothetical protein
MDVVRGRPKNDKTVTFKKKKTLVKSPTFGLDTKTYWLTDRQSQCDFDFDFDLLDVVHKPSDYVTFIRTLQILKLQDKTLIHNN